MPPRPPVLIPGHFSLHLASGQCSSPNTGKMSSHHCLPGPLPSRCAVKPHPFSAPANLSGWPLCGSYLSSCPFMLAQWETMTYFMGVGWERCIYVGICKSSLGVCSICAGFWCPPDLFGLIPNISFPLCDKLLLSLPAFMIWWVWWYSDHDGQFQT